MQLDPSSTPRPPADHASPLCRAARAPMLGRWRCRRRAAQRSPVGDERHHLAAHRTQLHPPDDTHPQAHKRLLLLAPHARGAQTPLLRRHTPVGAQTPLLHDPGDTRPAAHKRLRRHTPFFSNPTDRSDDHPRERCARIHAVRRTHAYLDRHTITYDGCTHTRASAPDTRMPVHPPAHTRRACRARPAQALDTHTHALRSSSSLVLTITPLSLTWRHLRLHGFTGSSPTSACSVVSCTASTTIAAVFRITAVRHDPHSAATTSARRPRVPGPAPCAL